MGKLTKHAQERDPSLSSADKIAAHVHAALPAKARGTVRALGNRVRKLDDGDDAWWRKGANAAQLNALLEVLGFASQEQLFRLVAGGARAPRSIWNLSVLGEAHPLDLAREPLFPGIPRAVTRPADWGRLIWYAPKGAGKTVVGQWLVAQRLATVRTLNRARNLPATVSDRPLYVELTAEVSDGDVCSWLAGAPDGVCVAVPFDRRPQASRPTIEEGAPDKGARPTTTQEGAPDEAAPPHTLTTVETPPIDGWLPALVAWISDRLPQGGGFHKDPRGAARFLSAWASEGMITTPGDALIFAGMIEHLGPDKFGQLGFGDLVRRYLLMQLQRFGQRALRSRMEPWVDQTAPRTLSRLVAQASVRGQDVTIGLPETIWVDGLRDGATARGSLDLLRRQFQDPKAKIDPRQLLATHLAPNANDTLKGLVALQILERRDGGLVALQPSWLAVVLNHAALEQALSAEPDQEAPWWGEYLLVPERSKQVVELVDDAIAARPTFAEEAIRRVSNGDVFAVPAVEACFRAAGRALLRGRNVNKDLLERLWKAQMAIALVTFDGWPPVCRSPIGEGSSFSLHVQYVLAAWAISESLPFPVTAGTDPRLVPWRDSAALSQLGSMSVHSWFDWPGVTIDDEVTRGAVRLLGRLFDRHRASTDAGSSMFKPMRLVEALRSGLLVDPDLLTNFLHRPIGWRMVLIEAERVGMTEAAVVAAAWRGWKTLPQDALRRAPPFALSAREKPDLLRVFWRHAPPDQVEGLTESINGTYDELRDLIWSTWDDGGHHAHWVEWIAATARSPSQPADPRRLHRAWAHLPVDLLLIDHFFQDPDFAPHAMNHVWMRAPVQLSEKVADLMRTTDEALSIWLSSSPQTAWQTLLPVILSELNAAIDRLSARLRRILFIWFSRYVELRLDQWNEAFRAMARLYPVGPMPPS
jgi:hypothetical protein